LIKAKSLVQVALQNFWDDEKGMFFYTPGSSELMVRKWS
jgi:uncharacterized protein YyaL (SSP411 family)